MPGPWSLTVRHSRSSCTATRSSSRPLAGEKRAAFSSTLTNAARSMPHARTAAADRQARRCTRSGANTTRRRLSALPTISAGATQSRASLRPPCPRRVMSNRFWMKRSRRSASSWVPSNSSRRSSSGIVRPAPASCRCCRAWPSMGAQVVGYRSQQGTCAAARSRHASARLPVVAGTGQGLGQRLAKGDQQARRGSLSWPERAHAQQRQRLLIHRQWPPPPAPSGRVSLPCPAAARVARPNRRRPARWR